MKYRMRTLVILVVLFPAPLVACLWDSDTLEEERRQFPSVLERSCPIFQLETGPDAGQGI
jgi:hypothetical protein